jgi:hypothetical protein
MAKILDMSEGGVVLDMGEDNAPRLLPMDTGRSRWEVMWDAARIGFKDTIRGVQQISGINEQELDDEQKYLDNLLADPEYGGWAKAAYFAGLIADPAGWLLPVSKLRTASKIGELVLPGAVGGGIAGGLSYIPEGESRAETAALGAGLGAAVGPVAMAAKKAYEPVGDAVWKVMRQPEGAGAIAGGGLGLYNADENAPIQEKMLNALQMALVGGATGIGARQLNKSTDGALARAIIPDYDLADAWIYARSKFKGSRAIAAGEFEKITKEMAELPIEQRKILYGMLTDKDAFLDENNQALRGLAQEARDTINKYSEQLIDLGVLTRKTYDENKDTYIHRVYNDPDRIKGTAPQRIQVAGDELYLRGNVKKMPLSEWNKGDRPDNIPGWQVVKKEEFLEGKGAPRVTIRRDWTENERLQMGEIKDVMVSFDRTGRLLANDVSALRFFKEMADNPEIAIKKQEDAPSNWVKVDDNRAYGALADMFVSKATLADLKAIRELNLSARLKQIPLFDQYRKLNRLWKGSKTIANPAVHFNNFTSNIIHYDFANGNTRDFFRAIKDIKRNSDDFVQAQERGVFGGFFGSEVAKDAMPLVEMYSEKAGIKDNMMLARGGIEYASKVAAAAGKAKKYTWDVAAKLYNLEDQVFRMALYRTERDRLIKSGLGKDDAMDMAARKAREWFVDYERNSPVLEALREGPLPFASYMYGVVPKLAETAAKKPIKFAKWGLLFAGLNELGEQDETQRSLIEKEYPTMFGIPGMPSVMTKLPEAISPQTRDDWYLNIGRSLPGGNIFGVEDLQVGRVPGLPESLQPSFGAAGGIYDALTGINRFTGQTNASLEQRASDLARQFIPNLPIPGFPSYSGERIERALSGKYSPTRDVYTPTTAIMSGLGMKVQPVSTSKLKKRRSAEFNAKKRNIQSTRKKAYRDFLSGQIDELEWEEAKKQYTEDLKKLRRSR